MHDLPGIYRQHVGMASPADRNPDVVVAAFLAALARDRAVGASRNLSDYQRRYAGYEVEIAAAWDSLTSDGEAQVVDSGECVPGSYFAGYQIRSVLGRGGQAVVYEAFDEGVGRAIALKVLHQSRLWSPDARRRFAREVEVTSRLEHPGICPVYARGFENSTPWIAMRALQGQALAASVETVARGDWRVAVRHLVSAARAVAHAHELGVVHRDLKPGNLWLDEEQRVVVLYFGLASDHETSDVGQAPLTRSGDLFGTVGYMAPEQLVGGATSPRTDVFALAVVLFELLAGERPYPCATVSGYERAVLVGPPDVRQRRKSVPRDLSAVLRVAMASNPSERYVDAASLVRDLEAVLAGRAIEGVPPGPLRRLSRWMARERALAVSLLVLVSVAAIGIAAIVSALDRAQANAARSAITAASALLRSQQVDAARVALDRCPVGYRGFAYQLLFHQLQAGAPYSARDALGLPAPRQRSGPAQVGKILLEHAGRTAALPPPQSKWLAAYNEDLSRVALETVLRGGGGVKVEVTAVDGETLASWDLTERDVTAMAFAPDTGWLWCAVRRTGAQGAQMLQAYGIRGGEKLFEREIGGAQVTTMLPLCDHRLVLGHRDGLVQLLEPGRRDHSLLCWHNDEIVDLRRTPDGVLSRDVSGASRHWGDTVRGAARVLDAGPAAVHALAFDEALEVWSSRGPQVAWQPATNEVIRFDSKRVAQPPKPSLVARHPDEALTITGQADGTVLLRMGEDEVPVAAVASGTTAVTSVVFHRDGDQFAVGHDDGMVAVFSVQPWLPASVAVEAAKQRVEQELAEVAHEWQLGVTADLVPATWHELERRRLLQRRVGSPYQELQAVLNLPHTAGALREFAAKVMDARLRSLPRERRSVNLYYVCLLAQLRIADFARWEELLEELPVGMHAMRPTWRTVAAILRGDPDAELAATVGLRPVLAKELRMRASPAGARALSWLDGQNRKGLAQRPVRFVWGIDWRPSVRDLGGSELVSAVAVAMQPPTVGVSKLVSNINRWVAHPGLPLACYECLLHWAQACASSGSRLKGAVAIRAYAALLGASMRCGDEASLAHAGRALVDLVDDWRDLDPVVGAFLALGGAAQERLKWVDRAEATALLRGQRRPTHLRLLLREVRERNR